MTALAGTTVRIYVDSIARVQIGDVIETQTGRRYGIVAVREQRRGKHVGRQHLRCVVLESGQELHAETRVHRIGWYRR